MAWPGDAGGKPDLDFEKIGALIGSAKDLWPLLPRIQAAIETFDRVENDPKFVTSVLAVKALVAEYEILSGDQGVKDAIATALEVLAIVNKKRP